MRQAQQRTADLATAAKNLAEDRASADAKGVEGSDAVRSAQDRLAASQDAVTAAQQRIADANQAVVDSAARIAQAQQGVADANQRVIDANGEVAASQQRITDAQQGVVDAAHGDRAVVVLLVLDFLERGGGIFLAARFLGQLLPDLGEFGIDHAGRHIEIMPGGQHVEQLALHLGAGQPGGFLFQLAAQQALELVEAFQTEALGEIIVDLGFAGHLDRLDHRHQ